MITDLSAELLDALLRFVRAQFPDGTENSALDARADDGEPRNFRAAQGAAVKDLTRAFRTLAMDGPGQSLVARDAFVIIYAEHRPEDISLWVNERSAHLDQSPSALGLDSKTCDRPVRNVAVLRAVAHDRRRRSHAVWYFDRTNLYWII